MDFVQLLRAETIGPPQLIVGLVKGGDSRDDVPSVADNREFSASHLVSGIRVCECKSHIGILGNCANDIYTGVEHPVFPLVRWKIIELPRAVQVKIRVLDIQRLWPV